MAESRGSTGAVQFAARHPPAQREPADISQASAIMTTPVVVMVNETPLDSGTAD